MFVGGKVAGARVWCLLGIKDLFSHLQPRLYTAGLLLSFVWVLKLR